MDVRQDVASNNTQAFEWWKCPAMTKNDHLLASLKCTYIFHHTLTLTIDWTTSGLDTWTREREVGWWSEFF